MAVLVVAFCALQDGGDWIAVALLVARHSGESRNPAPCL
jgi:hypothetical protein